MSTFLVKFKTDICLVIFPQLLYLTNHFLDCERWVGFAVCLRNAKKNGPKFSPILCPVQMFRFWTKKNRFWEIKRRIGTRQIGKRRANKKVQEWQLYLSFLTLQFFKFVLPLNFSMIYVVKTKFKIVRKLIQTVFRCEKNYHLITKAIYASKKNDWFKKIL